jgi:hypothetical protein
MDKLGGQKSLGPLKMSLEMAHKVIAPQKKFMSRSFLNSGTLIVIIHFKNNLICENWFISPQYAVVTYMNCVFHEKVRNSYLCLQILYWLWLFILYVTPSICL